MYNVLLCFFKEKEKGIIKNLCLRFADVNIIDCDNITDVSFAITHKKIDLFLFNLDYKENSIFTLPLKIRKLPEFKFTEMMFFSTRAENFISIFLKFDKSNYFLLPFDKAIQDRLLLLISNLKDINNLFNQKCEKICKFDVGKSTYLVSLDDILFIESYERKSIIHTLDDVITVNLPFSQIIKILPDNNFMQTHRSYLVNLENINHVIKNDELWYVTFNNCTENALVSRSHRKELKLYFETL